MASPAGRRAADARGSGTGGGRGTPGAVPGLAGSPRRGTRRAARAPAGASIAGAGPYRRRAGWHLAAADPGAAACRPRWLIWRVSSRYLLAVGVDRAASTNRAVPAARVHPRLEQWAGHAR